MTAPTTQLDGAMMTDEQILRIVMQSRELSTKVAWTELRDFARALLSASKPAAVTFVFPPMPQAVVMHDKVGPLFDRLSMQFYAAKCMRIAAPQPAQTERALTRLANKWERWQEDGDQRGCPSTNGLSTAISDVRALLTAAQPASGGDHE